MNNFDDLMLSLLQYAYDHKISYTLTTKLDPYTPPVSKPENKMMIINMNWHCHEAIPFQTAHELGHIVNRDEGILYYSPGSFKHRFERAASLKALDIILPMYIAYGDGESPRNYQTVMEQLCIPGYLENDVHKKLERLS
ncbi:ImmA/IrrE family metallo-endopeptidase [Lactobacillus plantarum subsp. plantarum] [Lactiplantibacillus mudanjiangensis]|uniref:ImmA/IrrE family metallo-endopeptidase n=1 Tax=Lactiplantibacillus mudanjiangensis TaxID=1296538 RepID=UPI00101580FA|nr:ImmA/IrrE family metallo-endopeptidase [Lactobacillus plantarum subsp. plantarum] [Lactiplantibacillus mudanjiangensis]